VKIKPKPLPSFFDQDDNDVSSERILSRELSPVKNLHDGIPINLKILNALIILTQLFLTDLIDLIIRVVGCGYSFIEFTALKLGISTSPWNIAQCLGRFPKKKGKLEFNSEMEVVGDVGFTCIKITFPCWESALDSFKF
jgi:hypothetical protein